MRLASVSLQVTCYISSLVATSDASPVLGEVPLPNTFTLMSLAGLLMLHIYFFKLEAISSLLLILLLPSSWPLLLMVPLESMTIVHQQVPLTSYDILSYFVSTLFCIFQWHSLDIYVIHFDFELDENSAIYDSKLLLFLCAWSIFCKCSSFFFKLHLYANFF